MVVVMVVPVNIVYYLTQTKDISGLYYFAYLDDTNANFTIKHISFLRIFL